MPDFKIAGIGASAGGLNALKALIGRMPPEPGLSFVVVVHLAPNQKSHLAELLQPHSPLPVQQVTETVEIEPNRIYVIPPNANLDAVDTHLRLSSLEEQRLQRAPIDHFFKTLADAKDGNAIGVILSGTGSDGTLGLRRIKESGGITIVQDPSEAEYDGMPRSAIASGVVDHVLPVGEITDRILKIARTTPELPLTESTGDSGEDDSRLISKVFAQVRARTGHDFSEYKRSTIMRRIARRMQVNQIERLDKYLDHMRDDRREVNALFDDLLITVTEFFRDPAVFEQLATDVVPKLFDRRKNDDTIRIWSVGCSTGEEAYSLAMVMLEEASRRDLAPQIQIFATDLHERSLKSAREGVFPESIASDVTPERLKRFFVTDPAGFRVRKEVRELVLFAGHDLLRDPPFSHLDLIACRNVLIYLQRDVQTDVATLFHYALNQDGLLLLGTAETIDGNELFQPELKPINLYRRRTVPMREPRLPVFPYTVRKEFEKEHARERSPVRAGFGAIHSRMVEHYGPPSILVNENHDVVHYSAHAGRYLQVPGGEPTTNIFRMISEPLRVELRAALQRARERGSLVRTKPIEVDIAGARAQVLVSVRPAPDPELNGFYLVFFDETDENAQGNGGVIAASPAQRELEAELDLYKQRLQSVIEEFETTKEEMRASNEELQSANEELRSTMEELETSKEELQSMNEELATVNQENRHRVEELSQLTGDLQNLLAATDIATLFLDRELRIVRFTPRVAELFNIRNSDKGRPLSDLTHRLGETALREDARRVLDRLIPVEREVRSDGDRWYLVRVLPYRSPEDRIEGVVITFVDITERKSTGEALRLSEESFQRVQNVEGIGVLHFDQGGRLVAANETMFTLLGYTAEDVADTNMSWRTWTPPEYMELSEQAMARLRDTGRVGPYEKEIIRKDGTRIWMIFAGARLGDGTVVEYGIDVTDRKRAEASLMDADRRKNEFIAVLAHELRNPLTPIVAGLEILKAGNGSIDAEYVRQIMERQARQLVRLVDDLMDVSRIVGGKLQVRLAPCRLEDAVRDAVDAVHSYVDDAQQTLSISLPEESIVILGDLDRVTQVISNLLTNAARYTPQRGHVTLSVRRDGDFAELTVTDTGVGIPPEMREQVFGMFAQLSNVDQSKRAGLGIGLTLVKSIVEMHGGTITVGAGPDDGGSQFTVRLPTTDEVPRMHTPVDEPAIQARPARVLVVDDQVDAAQMLSLMVKTAGHDVRVATGGAEAINVGRRFQPDVVLLDIGMPSMDGVATAGHIRNSDWGKSLTLVAVTGWGQDEDRRRTYDAGFNHHLVKPADPEILASILSRAPRNGS